MSVNPVTRQRPRAHNGRSASEQAVFTATEGLLGELSLQDITVAKIIKRAGVSRANFYHYFASKADVLAALLARLLDETYEVAESPWQAQPGKDRARSLDASLRETVGMWAERGAVSCAAIENIFSVPQVTAAWLGMRERFIGAVSEQIEHERAGGRAPSGPAAETLAAVLVCGVERTFHVGARGFDPALVSGGARFEAFTELTFAAIYGVLRSVAPLDVDGSEVSPTAALPPVPGGSTGNRDAANPTAEQILQRVERLLDEVSLEDLSVERIIADGTVSRATFYAYFSSKDDAFAALFRRVSQAQAEVFVAAVENHRADRGAIRTALRDWVGSWTSPAMMRNALHEWPRRPELREPYLAGQVRCAEALAAQIEADRRETGVTGPTVAPLAASLVWTIERSIAGSLAGEPHLEDLDQVADVLGELLGAVLDAPWVSRTG
ncbi:TetR/AcrR family transcriptional regulator [Pseudonocardia pini]|uniref:TetR/AcrR family transcriptional regulator n=1 Tax=Pseudonocardia pini TaxID=2758030 RepID=UPI001C68851D|nr:TetR/AcrR family transcriptional regulator [Pseudonocardia pini]